LIPLSAVLIIGVAVKCEFLLGHNSKSFKSVRFEKLLILQFGFFFAQNDYPNENQINNK